MKNSFSPIQAAFATSLKVSLKLFLASAFMLAAAAMSGQTFTPKGGGGKGFDVTSGIVTGQSVTIEGKVFDLFETKSGSRYIKCTSPNSGDLYAVWVGTPTEYKHEGLTVYQSAKGSYCVLKLSATSGNPYAVWLDKQ